MAGRSGPAQVIALLWLWLSLAAAAKEPLAHPDPSFAIRLPAEWSSPAPEQWCSPDGTISVVWSQLTVSQPLDTWAQQSFEKFPGSVMSQMQSSTVDGQPLRWFMGEHLGRLQRVYLTCRGNQGVLLVCSCTNSQSFAAVAEMQKILASFRWL